MTLGKRIRNLRLEKGLSLRGLGKIAHISHSFIADIESGRSKPSLSTLKDLATALGTTTSYLLGEQTSGTSSMSSPEQKIKSAISDDPELSEFWHSLSQREDLKILMRQVRDMSPKDLKMIIRLIKAVEDEELEE